MANRIKGIIVEIGGDTSNLSAALKGLDSDISKTQSQLRDVNKLLKLDPHNTELLAQKHKLLSQAVDDTSKRLKELKDARKAAEGSLKNYDDWKAAIQPVQDEIGKTSDKLNKLKKQRDEMEKSGDINSDAFKALNAQIDETSAHLDELKKRQKEINDEFGHPISPEQYDSLKREIIDTENKLKGLKTQADESAVALQKIAQAGEGLQKLGGTISGVGKALAPLSGAAALGLGAATKAAIDYETAFTGVMKTNDELIDENGNVVVSYEDLSDAIKDLSTRTAASKSDIAAVMEGAGQLGVGTEYLADFTEAMVMLGDTTNLSADEASTAIAKFANITNMSLDNADRLGATLVDLGNNFATDEQSIMEMATRLAGAGHQIGLTEAEILGFATALSSVGIEAEMGGSAFSKAMIKMQVATETGSGAMDKINQLYRDFSGAGEEANLTLRDLEMKMYNTPKDFKEFADNLGITSKELTNLVTSARQLQDFAEVAQMDVQEFSDLFKNDAPAAMDAFIRGLGDTDTAGESTIQMLQDMGFTEVRLRDTLTRAASAQDLFSDAVKAGSAAWDENAALTEEAEKRYGTTEAKLSQLKETITNIGIDLGEVLLPVLQDIIEQVKKIAEWFSKLDDDTKERIVKIGLLVAALSPLLIGLGSLISTIGTIMTLAPKLGAAMSVAKGAVALFTGPVGIAVGIVVALGAAFITAYKKSETFRNGVNKVVGWITDKLNAVKTWGKDLVDNFVSGLDENPVFNAVHKIAKTIFDFLHFSEPEKGPLANFHTFAPDMVQTFADGITSNSGLVENAAGTVAGLVRDELDTIPEKLSDVETSWENKWGNIRDDAQNAGEQITAKCNALNDNISRFKDGFSDRLSRASDAVKSFRDGASSAWDDVKKGASTMADKLASSFDSIRQSASEMKDKVVGAFGAMRDSIAEKVSAAKNWGNDLIANFTGGIQDNLSNLESAVDEMAETVSDRVGFSKPKKGPLSDADTYAPDMVSLFADGIRDNLDTLTKATDSVKNAVKDSLALSQNFPALAQVAVASTSPVKAALSAPLPSTYPNTYAYQNAVRGQYSPVSGVPTQTTRQAPVNFTVTNVVGGARVARLQYQYNQNEKDRRGPSLVKL